MGLFGMIVLCWGINAVRLRLLLGPQGAALGRWRSLGVIMATEFAICSTPGGSGGPLALVALVLLAMAFGARRVFKAREQRTAWDSEVGGA